MSDPVAAAGGDTPWGKHRVEALTDGIFAVAMTLLVIELKIPDPHAVASQHDLLQALAALLPKFVSWVISFFVLAIFWISHHRLFHFVRHVDAPLLWRNVFQLALVSLMPFAAALVGEYPGMPVAQAAYNGNMAALAALAALKLKYVYRHPGLTGIPLDAPTYHAALLRNGALMLCAVAAMAIAATHGTQFATFVYLLMFPIGRFSRHREKKARLRLAAASPSPLEHP